MGTPDLTSVVCWRWRPMSGYRSTYGPETVNTLLRMVRRHYPRKLRFLCVTDDTDGLDPDVEVVKPWDDFATVPSPHGQKHPSCYRRLRAFHPEIGDVFGARFVSLDLDSVIVADLSPIWDRDEDFVIWGDTNPRTFYNGSMFMLTAGARPQLWTAFDPNRSPQRAMAAGNHGSDQAWISYCLGNGEAKWTRGDGVYSFRNEIIHDMKRLPSDARVVFFHGNWDPWTPYVQTNCPWVREHWQ